MLETALSRSFDEVIQHRSADLERIFNAAFSERFNARLIGGGEEPIYLPSTRAGDANRIIYRHDYFASALHEISHWCIAGESRLLLEDYGYWYSPDGRNQQQQQAFETVEVKPQALEWMFSVAAGYRFRLSADNLNGAASVSEDFARNVVHCARTMCAAPDDPRNLPSRGREFVLALELFYGTERARHGDSYHLADIAPDGSVGVVR
ncbi:MAG: elongation factor P hydroxylase [bacterium]